MVTGGAGFIGGHLAEGLIGLGHEVFVLDDLSSGMPYLPPGGALIEGSVADLDTVAEAFSGGPFDAIFHFAAFAAEGVSHLVRRHNYLTNVIGSVNLINRAVDGGCGVFVFASSIAVYGHGRLPMREQDVPKPADSYGIAKYTVELELAAATRLQGFPHVALRMHNVYGERQNLRDPYRNAVAIFLNQIMRGEPITLYGDGSQVRAFTYVRDLVEPIIRCAAMPSAWNATYNLGSATPTTVRELAEVVRDVMGVPEHPLKELPRRDEAEAAYTDTSLARRVLGGWEERELRRGIESTAAWARSVGPATLISNVVPEVIEIPPWAKLVDQRLRS